MKSVNPGLLLALSYVDAQICREEESESEEGRSRTVSVLISLRDRLKRALGPPVPGATLPWSELCEALFTPEQRLVATKEAALALLKMKKKTTKRVVRGKNEV